MIISDKKFIKICFLIFTISILALGLITTNLEKENVAIIKKINQNNRFLNITIQINQNTYEATAFTNKPLNIEQGDYILIKGTIKNNNIQLKKIIKLTMLSQ